MLAIKVGLSISALAGGAYAATSFGLNKMSDSDLKLAKIVMQFSAYMFINGLVTAILGYVWSM